NRDGTRADADAAESRDAEQEQGGTGGRQAVRRRPGGHRGGGATRVVAGRAGGRGVRRAVGRAAVRRGAVALARVALRAVAVAVVALAGVALRAVARVALRALALVALRTVALVLVAVVTDARGRAALAVGVGEAARRHRVAADVHRHADRRGDRVARAHRDVVVPGDVAVVAVAAHPGDGRAGPADAAGVGETE